MDVDIHGAGRLQSMDGRAGTGYDETGAAGVATSGTYGVDGSVGLGGAAGAAANAYLPRSRSHGNTLPPIPLLAASSPSVPLVVPNRADLETVERMLEGDPYKR